MDLEMLKMHLRVDHSFEDNLIMDYQEWAEDEIKDSVSTEMNRNENYFIGNSHFNRAVVMLTAYYFENRTGYSERAIHDAPDTILSAVQKLRGSYISSGEVV